jgi:hypothetical protein
MRHTKAWSGLALALSLAAGCSVETAGSLEELESGELGASSPTLESEGAGVPSARDIASDSVELARIDFSDGNSVRFEELDGGVLVTETGPELNPNHLVPHEGMTALEAFRTLAPGREVPAALMRMHQQLYEGGSDLAAESVQPTAVELSPDADLEHNGQFQQTAGSYPYATFNANMCNIPNVVPNYRFANLTAPFSKSTPGIHTAYFAVGSDIGIITAKACSDNKCGGAITLQAGYHNSGFYDAGDKCEKTCAILGIWSCVTICVPRKVKFDVITNKVSTNVRYHECAAFTL